MRVLFSEEGRPDFDTLPATIRARIIRIIQRLASWPNVAGARPLRGEWQGHHRIRTGDWRVIFHIVEPDLIIVRIKHRSDVYED